MKTQIAGRLADAFLTSKLTPLLLAAALGLGVYTSATLPSEEEPQIIVPLADIYLPMPGVEPEEIENRALIPLENALSGIDGVEYVYSHAQPGFGLVTVRYEYEPDTGFTHEPAQGRDGLHAVDVRVIGAGTPIPLPQDRVQIVGKQQEA